MIIPEIPKVKRVVELCKYAKEFGEEVIQVWVNPGREVLDLLDEVAGLSRALRKLTAGDGEYERVGKELEEGTVELMARLWETTPEEVRELKEKSFATDPALVNWLIDESINLLRDHRMGVRKN
jgi:hypothetical protein